MRRTKIAIRLQAPLFVALALISVILFGQELSLHLEREPIAFDEIAPQVVTQGEDVILKLSGEGFQEGGAIRVLDSEGIAVKKVNVVRDTLVRFLVGLDPDVPVGWRSIEWKNPDGSGPPHRFDLAFRVAESDFADDSTADISQEKNPTAEGVPEDEPPEDEPPEDIPPQDPPEDIPPRDPPKDVPPQEPPKDVPPQEPPKDVPPQEPPKDVPPQDPPKDVPPQEPPKDGPPQDPPKDGPMPKDDPPRDPPIDGPPKGDPPTGDPSGDDPSGDGISEDNPPPESDNPMEDRPRPDDPRRPSPRDNRPADNFPRDNPSERDNSALVPPRNDPPEEDETTPEEVPPPPVSDSDVPFGIYSLDVPLDLPFVDGVVIRTRWSEVEPQEGQYDFSDIERALREAVALGQGATLANMVFDAPAWLNARAETFIDGDGRRKVVPWNPDMLEALERLAEAQSSFEVDGISLRDHPNIRQVNAPIGGISSLRMTNLPSGYTVEGLTGSVFRSVRAWADAYPVDKHLYVGIFVVNDGLNNPSTAELIRDQLLAEFNGRDNPRINFFQENLTGEQPFVEGVLGELLLDVRDQTGIMMQACGSWTEQNGFFAQCTWTEPVDTPDNGFSHGVNDLGATYFEIYPADLENPRYTSDFERWWPIIQQFGN